MTEIWLDQYGQQLPPLTVLPQAWTVQLGDFVEHGGDILEVVGKEVDVTRTHVTITIRTHPANRPDWAKPEKVTNP